MRSFSMRDKLKTKAGRQILGAVLVDNLALADIPSSVLGQLDRKHADILLAMWCLDRIKLPIDLVALNRWPEPRPDLHEMLACLEEVKDPVDISSWVLALQGIHTGQALEDALLAAIGLKN